MGGVWERKEGGVGSPATVAASFQQQEKWFPPPGRQPVALGQHKGLPGSAKALQLATSFLQSNDNSIRLEGRFAPSYLRYCTVTFH